MKVALLMSGAFRGNLDILDNIKEYIIDPLNADVFIATWDEYFPWMGIADKDEAHQLVLSRIIDNALIKKLSIPNEINEKAYMMVNMPLTYKKLSIKQIKTIPIDVIMKKLNPKAISIHSHNHFEKMILPEIYSKNLSQVKMFYLIYHSFLTMENYILKNYDTYDMCIRARPDLSFTKHISVDDINIIPKNYLFTKITKVGGVNDTFFVSDVSTMKTICSLWEKSYESKKLSPFIYYPQAVAHDLLLLWIIKNNIYVSDKNFTASTLDCAQDSIPDISNELLYDATHDGKKYSNEILALRSFLYPELTSK